MADYDDTDASGVRARRSSSPRRALVALLVALAASGLAAVPAAAGAGDGRAERSRDETPTRGRRQALANRTVADLAALLGCAKAKVRSEPDDGFAPSASTRCAAPGLTVAAAAQTLADEGYWLIEPPMTNPDSDAWAVQILTDPLISGRGNDTYSFLWTNDDGGTLYIAVNETLSPRDAEDGWTAVATPTTTTVPR